MVSEPSNPITNSLGVVTEKTVVRLRPHAGNLLWSSIVLIAATFGWTFGAGLLPELWMQIALAIAWGIVVILVVIIPWLTWLASRITITTHRVIVSRGLFGRERREVLFVRVTDVTVRRSAMQMMFGSGDVLLGVGAEQAFRIHAVPRPNLVVAALTELVYATNPRV